MALLAPRHPHLVMELVGDGPRRAELERLVASRGLASRVRFLGHREDVPALLAASDLFVLPSRSEAFPNGAMEAMAAGLPVIASAVGGLLDLIDQGRTGVLVSPDDPVALAGAIDMLAAASERAAALGAAARREIETRYSFDRMVGAFEDVYLSRLGAVRHAALSTEAA